MKKLHRPGPSAQRGAAALIVVLLLFFIISLVAAYTGRSLIFEHRTSTNQYRATQAFEAAEAGLEWALAMLNGGKIDADCVNKDDGPNTFRERYLGLPAADGTYALTKWADGITAERPSCIRADAGWTCSCPTGAAPTPEVPAGGGTHPAFRVCFERVPSDPLVPAQSGVVRVVSTGRTSFVDQPCDVRGEGTAGDSAATVSVVVALSSALATPPSAALTAVGNVDTTAGTVRLDVNGALDNALMISYGGPENALKFEPPSLRGTPIEHLIRGADTSLTGLLPGQMFASLFRMGESTYKNQPAAVRVDCAVDCSANTLVQKAQDHPWRIIWVNWADGNPTIRINAGTLGSDPEPVLVVASGNVEISATARITGLLYSSGDITITGNPELRGAVVAAGNINVADAPYVSYHPSVLQRLKLFTGSFVRVPGSWRDFQ